MYLLFPGQLNAIVVCDCRCLETTGDNAQRTASVVESVAISPQQQKSAQGAILPQMLAQGDGSLAGPARCGAESARTATHSPVTHGEGLATPTSPDTLARRENELPATHRSLLAGRGVPGCTKTSHDACMQVSSCAVACFSIDTCILQKT